MANATADRYRDFLDAKLHYDGDSGFAPTFLPDYLFPFQRALVEWALHKGRGAIFADCGLGKTLQELVWAENVYRHTGKPVLLLTPLAVAQQTAREAEKFGIDAARSLHGEISAPIVILNYERLHHVTWSDFSGVVCDESSCLKNFDGRRKAAITEFMRQLPFRLLATATAAPNDYIELGTSSEALGYLGYMDMLTRFFVNTTNTTQRYHGKYKVQGVNEWRFKGWAEEPFWRWVSSWARAMRQPSDLGFSDEGFDLPPLTYREHFVTARTTRADALFDLPARGFREEREERRRTIQERCERAAELVSGTGKPAAVWCHLNDEGDLLAKIVPDAVQVSGRDGDDDKEAKFTAFASGGARVLICKPVIGAWGLNWQFCNHIVTFPSHSYEQHYQAVRRCWRFGQTQPVVVDIVASAGEVGVQENLRRKASQCDRMFASLTAHMRQALVIERAAEPALRMEAPSWLMC